MADVTDLTGVISTLGIFANHGDATTPDWQYMCAMNARAFNVTRDERTTELVATCGPGASIETWRNAGALDWAITGEAALELETFDFARNWILNAEQRQIRAIFYTGDKNNLVAYGYYQGAAVLLEYPVNQADADSIPLASINIQKGAGTLTWTLGAPTP